MHATLGAQGPSSRRFSRDLANQREIALGVSLGSGNDFMTSIRRKSDRTPRSKHPAKTATTDQTQREGGPQAISRRRLFERVTAGAAALATGCAMDDNESADHVRVGSLDELAAGPVEFDLPGTGRCFAAKLEEPAAAGGQGADASVVAFSTLCPHMGCPIGLDAVDVQTGRFGPCNCHQSLFDIRRNGRMVHGRASSNLAQVELRVEGDNVYAIRVSGLAFGAALSNETALTTPLMVQESQDRNAGTHE